MNLGPDEGILIRPDAIVDYQGSSEGLKMWLQAM